MKAIRYIIFIPIIFVIVALVYTLLPMSLFALMGLSKFWLIVLLIFFGGLAVGIFALLPGGITWLSAKISPNKEFAFYSILMTYFGVNFYLVGLHSYASGEAKSLSWIYYTLGTISLVGIVTYPKFRKYYKR